MKFIRFHGHVIPIKESTKHRLHSAGESAASGAVAGAAIVGLSKAGQKHAQIAARTNTLATKAVKRSEKTLGRLKKALSRKTVSAKFQSRMADKILHNANKSSRLAGVSARSALAKTALRRGAFVVGGLALGNAADKAVQAVTGHETKDSTRLGLHAAGVSIAAVASSVLSKSRICKVAKLAKIAKMLKG